MKYSQPTGKAYSERQKLYNTKRWKNLRRRILDEQKYCQCPHHRGKFIPAEVVDHIKPHKGDLTLFWDVNNLQAMTKSCHDKFKQSQERGGAGFDQGCTTTGEPLNQGSHWYD